MFLRRLMEYSARLALPPALYRLATIRYFIDLDAQGRLRVPQLLDATPAAPPGPHPGVRHLVPRVTRTSGVRPLLLVDKAAYVLDTGAAHTAFVRLAEACLAATGEPAVAAVVRFLHSADAATLDGPPEDDPGALLAFRVAGVLPIDLPAVQRFWATYNDPAQAADRVLAQCLVCGTRGPVLRRWPSKIQGVPGGHEAGTVLVSANAAAFQSYGQAAALGAPTCALCAERVTQALNQLLADPQRHRQIGPVVYIFWARSAAEESFDVGTLLDNPDPAAVRALLASPGRGTPAPPVADPACYIAALTGNVSRVAVLSWADSTLSAIYQHLRTWFAALALVDATGQPGRPLGIPALAAATVRDPAQLPLPTVAALSQAALTGGPVTPTLLGPVLQRIRIAGTVTYAQAALIKLIVGRPGPDQEDGMVQLDTECPEPAYRCGRLLAVLERIQRLAIPGLTTPLVRRHYGRAATAPATIFGPLLRDARAHLQKLERDRPGAAHALQGVLEEIMGGLTAFPPTVPLAAQGLFALGYYHQRAADRAAAAAARAAATPPPGTETRAPVIEEEFDNE